MRDVLEIVKRCPGEKIVVLSAMAGTTNELVSIAHGLSSGDIDAASKRIDELYDRYRKVVSGLFEKSQWIERASDCVDHRFHVLRAACEISFTQEVEKEILAQGEFLSTDLFHLLVQRSNLDALWVNALDFMRIDDQEEPDYGQMKEIIPDFFKERTGHDMVITQGYICRDEHGEINNLQRGGSDFTATILGAILQAEEIQIWTDIDGVHNNDPRVVNDTRPIRRLSYREAAELAYFGAKILHPTCVLPAEKAGVPVRLKYTARPDAEGTLIAAETSKRPVTAIAAKDGITAIKIYSHRMLLAYGFLRKVFQVFEVHETPIDMITTSEVAVSLTIDQTHALNKILEELSDFGEVEAQDGYSIICIVGNELYNDPSYIENVFACLSKIPVRMISMGGSRYNISILIKTTYKKDALVALNSLFY
jgi:aspartate kinase